MTLEQYWTILLKQWRLVIICSLVVGLGALVASRLMTPIYQSTVLIQIVFPSGNNQSDYTSLLASDQLVQTEAILATSDPVLREVASHYPNLTVEQFAQEVTATPKLNTQLFEIDVADPSPTQAAALANSIATTLINQQLQIMQQQGAHSSSFLIVAQPAEPALRPIRPNILLNTGAGLLAGLLLGMLLAVLFEQLDIRVRTPEAISQLLNWQILATIWRTNTNRTLINPEEPDANIESYRILRTNIGFSAIDKPMRFIAITSPTPGDGKSVIAANLAIFMAKASRNTLLIDADLRRPTQHEIFGISADKLGLSNAILAFSMRDTAHVSSYYRPPTTTSPSLPPNIPLPLDISLDPFVHVVDIPNLSVMPSGPLPPNPPELLDSKAMGRLFTALASCGFDAIIFDTPPLLSLSDASILVSKVDGTLVVVDITRANKGTLRQAKALLVQAGTSVLGCVVNKQRHRRNDTTYSYYYNTNVQASRNNHSTKQANPAVVSPATPNVVQQPEMEAELDLLDRTVKVAPFHPREAETPSQLDLLDG